MSRVVAGVVLSRRWGSVSRKAVALVLADHADADEWATVLGQERIALEAEVSSRTVWSILNEFESEGLICRARRHRKDGTRTSDRTNLVRSAIESLPEAVASSDPDLLATDDIDYSQIPPPTTRKAIATQEPSVVEPSEEPSVIGLSEIKRVLVEIFGEPPPQHWSLYNRIATWIRARNGTIEEIRFKAGRIAEEWGVKALTVTSLEKHWTRYDAEVGNISDSDVEKYQSEIRRMQRRRRAEQLEAGK